MQKQLAKPAQELTLGQLVSESPMAEEQMLG
jgi:hypothetical protein